MLKKHNANNYPKKFSQKYLPNFTVIHFYVNLVSINFCLLWNRMKLDLFIFKDDFFLLLTNLILYLGLYLIY